MRGVFHEKGEVRELGGSFTKLEHVTDQAL